LEEKIKSSKLFKRVEIVIVSDGSKDKTAELIKDYTVEYTSEKDIVVRGIILVQN
jgi:glycosyltransferase involved in cell wall biosynthesis